MNVILTSPWVPPEWVEAHGHQPRGVWSLANSGHAAVQEGICTFAHRAVQLADTSPDSAIVFTTHCDQMRRACDALSGASRDRAFLFNLPATWQSPVSLGIYSAELERLGRFLLKLGGHPPAELDALCENYDEARNQLARAAEHKVGIEYAELVLAFHRSGSGAIRALARASMVAGKNMDSGILETTGSLRGIGAARPRCPIALVGGPFPPQCWDLFSVIAKAGGTVVLNGTENGERSLGKTLASQKRPPMKKSSHDLAQEFFSRCIDVFQRPNWRLYDWLRDRVAERNVRGVLLWHYLGCDLWRAEADTMKEKLRLPVLLIEAEEAAGVSPRLAGRVQAFMETLI